MNYYDSESEMYNHYLKGSVTERLIGAATMQTKIESFSDYKTNQYGPSAKVKLSSGQQAYINEDPTGYVGRTVEIELSKKMSKKGQEYTVGKISQVYEATDTASSGNGNGKITWDAYRAMAEAAHELAIKLEPDGIIAETSELGNARTYTITTDRSTARAAILNTVMIAYSNGKIFVPEDDDDPPPF